MGVVYLADDTKLERKVAIKFLPNRISGNLKERERFKREAKAAAALNHPNIATIHSIEEADGETFIVMEYIEGKELKDFFKDPASHSLPLKDIINYAVQIAEGLEAAHKKGIVHRDIKSQNIMINPEGKVKIMDFGLAKVKGGRQLTKVGTTFGTIAYMSPEQARGEEVDHRTDIWSFGVVFYEMLAGVMPFKGDYDQAIIYSIMNLEPAPIQHYMPDASPLLIKILSKTLKKNPHDRYASIRYVKSDLHRLEHSLHSGKTREMEYSKELIEEESSKQNTATGIKTILRLPRKHILIISTIIFACAFLYLAYLFIFRSNLPELNPNRSVSVLQIPVAEFDYPAISPDGNMLAIPGSDGKGNWDIYLMDIKSGASRKLNITARNSSISTITAGAMFSPDGSTIAFGLTNQKNGVAEVALISVLGGYAKIIADTGISHIWDPSGKRIYYFRGKPRAPSRSGYREYWSVSADGENKKLEFIDSLTEKSNPNFSFWISPDGKKLAFTRVYKGGYNDIVIRNLQTGIEKRLTYDRKTIYDIQWLNNGYILFNSNLNSNFNIWAVPASGGNPLQITADAGPDLEMNMAYFADRLIFQDISNIRTFWMVNTDGSDNRQVFPDLNVWDATYSPDANKVALIIFNHFGSSKSLVIRNLKTGLQETIIPYDSSVYCTKVRWSPYGNYISYLELSSLKRSEPRIKIIDVSAGYITRDYGYGELEKWVNDSVAVITKFDSLHDNYPYLSPRLLNVRNGQMKRFFRDSTSFAIPVLNKSRYVYWPRHSRYLYIISKNELNKNPLAQGKTITDANNIKTVYFTEKWFYYNTNEAIWKINLKTLRKTKILDLTGGIGMHIIETLHNDKVLTYVRHQIKTNLNEINDLFLK